MKSSAWIVAFAVGLTSAAGAQEFRPKGSGIPAAEIERAILKGMDWLKGVPPKSGVPASRMDDTNELVLYTLLHGGMAAADPALGEVLKRVVDREPDRVYNAALAAMALVKMDRAGYQWKLVQLAQFLVDNQCENGQWAYGSPVEHLKVPGEWVSWKGAPYGAKYAPGFRPGPGKTGSGRKIAVPQRSRVSKVGDNSNAQYAALGLRACAEGDVIIDPRCIADALRWWENDQSRDGGWGYSRGEDDAPRATMTAGGVGSLVIYRWMLHKPWADEAHIKKGMAWLDANPKVSKWHEYYFYGLERIGMLYGTDRIGSIDWFDKGADWLIDRQAANGSWGNLHDTCFAILFLRRATAPLPSVASVARPPVPQQEVEEK